MNRFKDKDTNFGHQEGIALKDYFDTRITELETALRDKFVAQDKALDLATDQLEKRLTLLNELRGNVITKTEYDARHYLLETKIEALQKIMNIGIGGLLVIEIILRFIK